MGNLALDFYRFKLRILNPSSVDTLVANWFNPSKSLITCTSFIKWIHPLGQISYDTENSTLCRKRQRYLNRNIPDCVLTSQHDTQMIRGEDALCLDGKPYLDSDYDPCEFRTPQHMRSTLPAQTPREAIIIQKTSSGKTDSSHVTCMSSVPQLDGNTTIHSKGSFGSTHVHYGSSAKPCQHHYESPSFSWLSNHQTLYAVLCGTHVTVDNLRMQLQRTDNIIESEKLRHPKTATLCLLSSVYCLVN